MKGRTFACGAAAWLVAVAVVMAVADVKVTPVVNDGRVSASFAAPAAFTPEAAEIVKTGMTVTFTFVVDLRRPSFWLDRTISTATLASSVKYDNLTRDYQLSKLQEGRVTLADHTGDEATMRRWVTTFDAVSLDSSEKLESNVEYYVRVHLRTTPRRSVWPWPFSRNDGTGQASFTFIR